MSEDMVAKTESGGIESKEEVDSGDDDEGVDQQDFNAETEEEEAEMRRMEKEFPTSASLARNKWTSEEDEILSKAVAKFQGRNWRLISECLSEYGRTDVQCLHRWQKVLRPGLVKGPWTEEEDACVLDLVNRFGVKSWSFIARQLKGRLGKQCRERYVFNFIFTYNMNRLDFFRWYNHLNPAINKEPWTAEEDALITTVHRS